MNLVSLAVERVVSCAICWRLRLLARKITGIGWQPLTLTGIADAINDGAGRWESARITPGRIHIVLICQPVGF